MPSGAGKRAAAGLTLAVAAGAFLLGTGAAAPARAGEAVLLAAGDIGNCTPAAEQGPYLTADLLAVRPEATILALGDLAYTAGTAAEFANCYGPTWGRFKDRTRPILGNHEHRTLGAAGYFGYWGARAGESGKGYYGFDLGDWHLVALNSEIDAGPASPQVAWLKADLAASPRRCKLAYLHRPRWSSGRHGDADDLAALFQVLYDARVTLLLSAHDHDYERLAPLGPSGAVEPGRGVRQFVVGTGGAPLRGFAAPRAGSEARDATAKGVLQLVLRADGYDWEFLPVAGGAYRDGGGGACVPAAPVPPPPSAGEFKPLQYIASHGDLIVAFGADKAAAERHWLAFGRAEGRAIDSFDEARYLANYPDLRAAFGEDGEAATRHYIRSGYFEGRDDGG
jgi:acid phosphatase type 7